MVSRAITRPTTSAAGGYGHTRNVSGGGAATSRSYHTQHMNGSGSGGGKKNRIGTAAPGGHGHGASTHRAGGGGSTHRPTPGHHAATRSLDLAALYQQVSPYPPQQTHPYSGNGNASHVSYNDTSAQYSYHQHPSHQPVPTASPHIHHHNHTSHDTYTHAHTHTHTHPPTYGIPTTRVTRPMSAAGNSASGASSRPSTSPVYTAAAAAVKPRKQHAAHHDASRGDTDDVIVKLGIQLGEATQRAQSSHGHRSARHSSSSSSSGGNKKLSDKQRSEGIRRSWLSVNGATHYTVAHTIGEGTFGKVKLGTHKLTGIPVAIKILEKDRICDMSDVERVKREIRILCRVSSSSPSQHGTHTSTAPCVQVIRLYQVIDSPHHIFLIMEYASHGELFDYIVKHQRVDESTACVLFHQIVNGVDSCHQRCVIHRDLKPYVFAFLTRSTPITENLLLTNHNEIRIVDFGLGNLIPHKRSLLKTACGSPCYAAPEMIRGQQYVGSAVDLWSCGVILYALLCGYLPFEDANTNKLYEKIMAGQYYVPSHVSSEARDLLSHLLCTEPSKRYTANDVRQHVWYKQCTVASDPVSQQCTDAYATHAHGGSGDATEQHLNQSVLDYMCEQCGYDREAVVDSVMQQRFDHYSAAYELLAMKHGELQQQHSSRAAQAHSVSQRPSPAIVSHAAAVVVPPLHISLAAQHDSISSGTNSSDAMNGVISTARKHTVRRKDSMEGDEYSGDTHTHQARSQAQQPHLSSTSDDDVQVLTLHSNASERSSQISDDAQPQQQQSPSHSIPIIEHPQSHPVSALPTPQLVDNDSSDAAATLYSTAMSQPAAATHHSFTPVESSSNGSPSAYVAARPRTHHYPLPPRAPSRHTSTASTSTATSLSYHAAPALSSDEPEIQQYPVSPTSIHYSTHSQQHPLRPTATLSTASSTSSHRAYEDPVSHAGAATVSNVISNRAYHAPLTARPVSRNTIQRAVLHSRGIVKTSHPSNAIHVTAYSTIPSAPSSPWQQHRQHSISLASPRQHSTVSGSSSRPASSAIHKAAAAQQPQQQLHITAPPANGLQQAFLISRPYALQTHRVPNHTHATTASPPTAAIQPHPPAPPPHHHSNSIMGGGGSTSRPLTARKPPVPRQNYGRKAKLPAASQSVQYTSSFMAQQQVENMYTPAAAPAHQHINGHVTASSHSRAHDAHSQHYFQRPTTAQGGMHGSQSKARSRVSSAAGYRGHAGAPHHQHTYTLQTQSPHAAAAADGSHMPQRHSTVHGHAWMNNVAG